MTVRKTVPGTQLLLYSAAVLVVAPLLLWMLYLFWLVWMRLFWLVQFSLEFFFSSLLLSQMLFDDWGISQRTICFSFSHKYSKSIKFLKKKEDCLHFCQKQRPAYLNLTFFLPLAIIIALVFS